MNKLLPFVALLAAIGLFFGYIRPAWSGEIAATKAEIASYDNALDAATRFEERQAELEIARAQLSPNDLERLDAFLPDSVDNVQLILDLNALADNAGIELSDFETGAVNEPIESGDDEAAIENPSAVDSLTISVAAKGTYSAFRAFLAGVEQSLRPLDVVALRVTDAASGVYTYEVTLRFYWLR